MATFGWVALSWLMAAALGGLASPARADDGMDAPVPAAGFDIVRPEELHRGQKGYGLSVFAGHQPLRFEVEVLGIVHQSTPELSYILARLTGQDLERSGVAAGMSGSPVYFDGKLAGAVAFSYLFSKDAIAGITPIAGMRAIRELPSGLADSTVPGTATAGGPTAGGPTAQAPAWHQMVEQSFDPEALQDGLRRLLGGGALGFDGASLQQSRAAITWTATGFAGSAQHLLTEAAAGALSPSLGNASGGAAAVASSGAEAAPTLQAGSGMAVVLVDGDLRLAAHGTVTERRGDEIVGFGHPMYGFGPVALPLASSEVITVVASVANSFKLSNAGPLVGTLDQDRAAGVHGRLGTLPQLTDLHIETHGVSTKSYAMRLAQLPQLRPLLIGVSVLGTLDASNHAVGRQGVDLDALFDLGADGELRLQQSFDGDDAALGAASYLMSMASFLDLNPWQPVDIRQVEVRLEQHDEARVNKLLSAQPASRRVRPGQKLALTLELEAWRGERFRHPIEVEIPSTAPPGSYWLMLGDGTSVDALELAIEKEAPQDLPSALRALGALRSRRQLAVLGMRGAAGLSVEGVAHPDLPPSLQRLFSQGQITEYEALRLVIDQRRVEPLPWPMDGALRIDLEVLPPRP